MCQQQFQKIVKTCKSIRFNRVYECKQLFIK